VPLLSSSIGEIKPHYDVVVVGSGYGGGVAASRLARAKKRVCVLERGKELLPGDFPDTYAKFAKETQINLPASVPGPEHIGPRTALYDFHVNDKMNVVVGCGLGGTSLINAGITMRHLHRGLRPPRRAPARSVGRPL
jgi:cholesterol oxidase